MTGGLWIKVSAQSWLLSTIVVYCCLLTDIAIMMVGGGHQWASTVEDHAVERKRQETIKRTISLSHHPLSSGWKSTWKRKKEIDHGLLPKHSICSSRSRGINCPCFFRSLFRLCRLSDNEHSRIVIARTKRRFPTTLSFQEHICEQPTVFFGSVVKFPIYGIVLCAIHTIGKLKLSRLSLTNNVHQCTLKFPLNDCVNKSCYSITN